MSLKDLDLVCFSHLRWNFVFQRPQHLLTRFAKVTRVFYVEEPIFTNESDFCQVNQAEENLWIVVPHLQHGHFEMDHNSRRKLLLSGVFADKEITNYVFWYYSPVFLSISDIYEPKLIVYDCMDELSAFKFAPPGLKESEEELFRKAHLVFTGGHSLYEAKRDRHADIYPFPSSIDKEHFKSARSIASDPVDQESIPHPRIGFYGVIDERMDLDLISKVANERPEWHFVLIGPTVKIDPNTLPRPANIHYLGNKSYKELPTYLAGWDISIIPFALNESTRFISPTKTPEYLSAGKPVISSSIQDVIRPYGNKKLVHIADTPEDFIRAAEHELSVADRSTWLAEVDAFLELVSWDKTWNEMVQLMEDKLSDKAQEKKTYNLNLKEKSYV